MRNFQEFLDPDIGRGCSAHDEAYFISATILLTEIKNSESFLHQDFDSISEISFEKRM
jgi:hypothetical protein